MHTFRRDILVNIGSYDEIFKCQDGYDIWLKFIQKYNPLNINLPLFYYRQHETSLSKKTGYQRNKNKNYK